MYMLVYHVQCTLCYICIDTHLHTMQLSYGASSPSLSSTEMFPNFFRTIPSEVQSNSARFALMKKFNWERVATLHETQTIFSQVMFHVHMYYMYTCMCFVHLYTHVVRVLALL